MAAPEMYTTAQPVDNVDELRHRFEMLKEQRAHIRSTLFRRLNDACAQLERQCKEMSQDLDRINEVVPDLGRPDSPEAYPTAVDRGYR